MYPRNIKLYTLCRINRAVEEGALDTIGQLCLDPDAGIQTNTGQAADNGACSVPCQNPEPVNESEPFQDVFADCRPGFFQR